MSDGEFTIRTADAVSDLPADQWDALTDGANPFMSHAFLSLLEESGSVGGRSGWQPLPIIAENAEGVLAGALPAYVKRHSQGEYVFDHSWADAFHRAGGDYYPKIQIAAPFTPATGPRVLTRNPGLALPLLKAAEELCSGNGLSSVHATFIEDGQVGLFERAGWLIRNDIQFHWERRGYGSFDEFLAALSSRKRKDICKERARAHEGLDIRVLTGDDIKEEHWDAFWRFYQDTGMRKWGTPYLTRAAFTLMGERMADRIALVMAFLDGKAVAGALNFIGAHTLFGRYWGALIEQPFLHFELCYYQAIDLAIALRLDRVEAGAQGGHKLARGYEPVRTTSAHFIAHEGFRQAVADFLDRERRGVAQEQLWLGERTPFRKQV
jgi:predicted N-acyltransferase